MAKIFIRLVTPIGLWAHIIDFAAWNGKGARKCGFWYTIRMKMHIFTLVSLASIGLTASGAAETATNLSLRAERFQPVHTQVETAELEGRTVLRVVKKDKIDLPDENTYAAWKGLKFRNGIIEARLRSRLLPNAPSYARGFIGIVYRAADDGSEFESFYVRPTNGRNCTDPVRKAHGCQYFAYPGYTFSYFREFGFRQYEASVDVALDEWFTLKAVIQDEKAVFYLNDSPVLTVPEMKHGKGRTGAFGIYVDVGTEAFVSDLRVTPLDDPEAVRGAQSQPFRDR